MGRAPLAILYLGPLDVFRQILVRYNMLPIHQDATASPGACRVLDNDWQHALALHRVCLHLATKDRIQTDSLREELIETSDWTSLINRFAQVTTQARHR